MARTPRNYPYNATTGALKDSAYSSIFGLALEFDRDYLKTQEGRDDFFDRARDLYPEIGDDDLWDVWREWYQAG